MSGLAFAQVGTILLFSNHTISEYLPAYGSPAYFLKILRRHAYEGAFAHPKYGGNVGAAGWAYLEGRFTDPATGTTLFNWERIMEPPLGSSADYRG